MHPRVTLEKEIIRQLSRLSDADMQRLATAYTKVRFSSRLAWLDGQALNSEGQTIGGRPDAFGSTGDDQNFVIEATRIADKRKITDKGYTRGHFHDSVSALARSGRAPDVFIYMAGHPDIQFSRDDISALKDCVAVLGISRKNVIIIGGDALVDSLCEPAMARARIEILGIGQPRRFSLVRADAGPDPKRRFKPGSTYTYIPSLDDLAAGTVHTPRLKPRVMERLAGEGVCLVRGVGASGKSVLAWLIGLDWAAQNRPSFIADLQYVTADPEARTSEYTEELMRFADPTALFIIDNCHLDEQAAWQILQAREALDEPPAMLFLGRETRSQAGTGIDGLALKPLLLRARAEEVRAVYYRLAARQLRLRKRTEAIPCPPELEVEKWVSTFGDDARNLNGTTDLIVFSAAAQGRIDQLLSENWVLRGADAADEIRRSYLQPLSNAQRDNLYRVAAFQKLEIDLAANALPHPEVGLDEATSLGIVFRSATGSGGGTFYRLAHASLGQLILTGATEPIDRFEEYKSVAAINGHMAALLYQRMLKPRTRDKALEIAAIAMKRRSLLSCPLRYWPSLLDGVRQSNLGWDEANFAWLWAPEVLDRVVANAVSQGEFSALGRLASWLAKDRLRPISQKLLAELLARLSIPDRLETLVRSAIGQGIESLEFLLTSFLGCSDRRVREIGSLMALKLTTPELRDAVLKKAAGSSTGRVALFVEATGQYPVLEPILDEMIAGVDMTVDGGARLFAYAESLLMEADVCALIERDSHLIAGRFNRIIALFDRSGDPGLVHIVRSAREMLAEHGGSHSISGNPADIPAAPAALPPAPSRRE